MLLMIMQGRGTFSAVLVAVLGATAGCATVDVKPSLDVAAERAGLPSNTVLQQATPAQREQATHAVDALLAQPVQQDDAVRVMLLQSPQWQTVIAIHQADLAQAQRSGQPGSVLLSFERLRSVGELELGRQLSTGLVDWLTWPLRYQAALKAQEALRWQLSMALVNAISQVRQAWVQAVAAEQVRVQAKRVHEIAHTSATLAMRMRQAGHLSPLQGERQQLFGLQSASQLDEARQAAFQAREHLVRVMGLDARQAERLTLPDRLPALPAQPMDAFQVSSEAVAQRLDVRRAQAHYLSQTTNAEASAWRSLLDVEVGGTRQRTTDMTDGHVSRAKGSEVTLSLPLWDLGESARSQSGAQQQAAYFSLEASVLAAQSSLRVHHAAYLTAYTQAQRYRQEILPMQQRISQEQLKRYNGMLIGIFDLLNDAQEQVHAVASSISAERQFWLAEAALRSALLGAETKTSDTSRQYQLTGPTPSADAAH